MDNDGIIALAKAFPNNKSVPFVQWFTNSDETIDGKSKSKAYALFESSLLDNIEVGTINGLKQIHAYLFGGLYDFAGLIRTVNTTRIWLDLILKRSLKKCVDWSQIDKKAYLSAMEESVIDSTNIKALLQNALTDKINDRETFMKGIDYSYYYEEN